VHARNATSGESSAVRGYESLADHLRDRLTQGDYLPGERLPNRKQLASELETTEQTLQRAMQLLIDNGFVVTRGRSGTFVSQTPPHLCRYALAFLAFPDFTASDNQHRAPWSMFDEVTCHVAAQLSVPDVRQIDCFMGLHPDVPDELSDREALIEAARTKTLNGIIFVNYPGAVMDMLGWVHDLGIPIVAFSSPPIAGFCSGISPRSVDLITLMINALVDRGCQRVARLAFGSLVLDPDDPSNTLAQELRARGLTYRPEWVQRTDLHEPEITSQIVRLLMSGPARERPDGLIIDDEHLVAPAVEILEAMGLRIGMDVQVAAHASFPISDPMHPGLIRVGYDVFELFERAHRMIAEFRSGSGGWNTELMDPVTQQGFASREAERIRQAAQQQHQTTVEEN